LPYLGASEAAGSLDLSPYQSPTSIYLEKIGEIGPKDLGNRGVWGKRLENAIAEAFEDEFPHLRAEARDVVVISNLYPWMSATLDRFVYDTQGIARRLIGVLEIKTADAWSASDWGTKEAPVCPAHVLIQLLHQMAVTGLPYGWVAVLIGTSDFRVIEIVRDERTEKMITNLVEGERRFWDLVEKRTPPKIDGSGATTDAIKRQYAEVDPEAVVQFEEDIYELIAEWHWRDHDAKAAKKALDSVANKIKDRFGKCEIGMVGERVVATYRSFSVKEKYVKAGTQRRLNVKEI